METATQLCAASAHVCELGVRIPMLLCVRRDVKFFVWLTIVARTANMAVINCRFMYNNTANTRVFSAQGVNLSLACSEMNFGSDLKYFHRSSIRKVQCHSHSVPSSKNEPLCYRALHYCSIGNPQHCSLTQLSS